jgi:hypothetical protein
MAHTFCRAGEEYAGAGLLVDRFLVEDGIGGEVEPHQIGARNVGGAARTFCRAVDGHVDVDIAALHVHG